MFRLALATSLAGNECASRIAIPAAPEGIAKQTQAREHHFEARRLGHQQNAFEMQGITGFVTKARWVAADWEGVKVQGIVVAVDAIPDEIADTGTLTRSPHTAGIEDPDRAIPGDIPSAHVQACDGTSSYGNAIYVIRTRATEVAPRSVHRIGITGDRTAGMARARNGGHADQQTGRTNGQCDFLDT